MSFPACAVDRLRSEGIGSGTQEMNGVLPLRRAEQSEKERKNRRLLCFNCFSS